MKYMDILQVLIFLVFLFSAVANSDHHCPISYCHNNTFPIKYPFRLQGQQTPNCNYTDLRCSSEGAVILDLPALGDFYVRDIHYGHGCPLILLYDPGNCLPKRFMSSNISSFHPGVAAHSLDYTFYSCPPHLISASKFSAVGCLSNSSSTTVATRTVSSRIMTELYRCKEIATSSMPVAGRHPPDFIGNQNDFVLEWLASCESCPYEEQGVVLCCFNGRHCGFHCCNHNAGYNLHRLLYKFDHNVQKGTQGEEVKCSIASQLMIQGFFDISLSQCKDTVFHLL